MAQDQRIGLAWLSDRIAQFLQETSIVPSGTRWLAQGKLEVLIPDAGYILTTKLLAGRERDVEDIEALLQHLHITTREQAERHLERYLTAETRAHYAPDLEATLDQYFSEEV